MAQNLVVIICTSLSITCISYQGTCMLYQSNAQYQIHRKTCQYSIFTMFMYLILRI